VQIARQASPNQEVLECMEYIFQNNVMSLIQNHHFLDFPHEMLMSMQFWLFNDNNNEFKIM